MGDVAVIVHDNRNVAKHRVDKKQVTILNEARGACGGGNRLSVLIRKDLDGVTSTLQKHGYLQELVADALYQNVRWSDFGAFAYQLMGVGWSQIAFNDALLDAEFDNADGITKELAGIMESETICVRYDHDHGVKFYLCYSKYGHLEERFDGMGHYAGEPPVARGEPRAFGARPRVGQNTMDNRRITDRFLREKDAIETGNWVQYFVRTVEDVQTYNDRRQLVNGEIVTVTNLGDKVRSMERMMNLYRVDYYVLNEKIYR